MMDEMALTMVKVGGESLVIVRQQVVNDVSSGIEISAWDIVDSQGVPQNEIQGISL